MMEATKNHWVLMRGRNGVIRAATRMKLATDYSSLMEFDAYCVI